MPTTPTTQTIEPTITAAQLSKLNSAGRKFHNAEDTAIGDMLKTLIGDAVEMASVVVEIRSAVVATMAKKDPTITTITVPRLFQTYLGKCQTDPPVDATLTELDFRFALAIPQTDGKPSAVKLLALNSVYGKRCAALKDDNGEPRKPTVPTWQGLRKHVLECYSFQVANDRPLYDENGVMDGEEVTERSDSQTDAKLAAATPIETNYVATWADMHTNDPVGLATAIRVALHDMTAAYAKVTADMSKANKGKVSANYVAKRADAVKAAKLVAATV